jgi:imidazolonepropionase-like amidohydrolase
MITLFVAAALTVCSPCVIQNVRVEVGDGTIVARANVVIDRGRIVSVGEEVPADAVAINGAGKILTPGFIETRSRLGIVEVEQERTANDSGLRHGPITPAFSVAWGYNPESVWIPIAREEGVTSAVLAPFGGIIAGSGAWVDLTGALSTLPDPLKPLAMFGAIGADTAASSGDGARGGLWLALRQAFADARLYKANRAAFDKGLGRPLSLSPLNLEALLPVLDGTLPLVLEANRASDILTALEFSRLERVRLVIAGGAEAWRVPDALRKGNVPVLLRPSLQEPGTFDQLATQDDLAGILDRAGVAVVISVNGGAPDARRLRQEAGMAVAMGMSRTSALKAITLNAAEAFGRGREYGSVTSGKHANVVLWSGDPLETSTVVERLWIDGEERSLDTRQRKLVERYRPKK